MVLYQNRENDFQHKIPLEKASNKILIYTGFHYNLWNDTLVDKENFCGGSQKAVAYLARYLPKNYEIFVSGDVKDEVIDNITYINHNNLQKLLNDNKFHTIIVSRYVSFFLLYPKFKCYQLYLTAQDFEYMNKLKGSNILPKTIIENNNDIIDGAVCLTKFHKNNTEILYPMFKDKLVIINNGINPQDFKFDCNQKINNKFVWTSTAYRGLEILLDLWTKILEKLPDATLDISSYYTFPNNEHEIKMKEIIDNHDCITHHGKLNTEELYQLTSTAEYWLYTNTFAETSCITGMEMLMNEVICLYYPVAGLVDTVGDYGIKVERGNEIDTILNLSEERKTELRKKGKEYALTCSWENRAKEWNTLLGLSIPIFKLLPDNGNFGDSVNILFWEKITGYNIKYNDIVNNLHYITTGSIMCAVKNKSIIFGTGFIHKNADLGGLSLNNNKLVTPKKVLAVRGPLSREKMLNFGIECPKNYGDPLILLPCIYNKSIVINDNIIGIIPHYIDVNNDNLKLLIQNLKNNGYNIKIIDILVGENYKDFIDNINSCKYIISSSLHGIIMGLVYKKETIFLEFSNNVIGGDFKFQDFFQSINIYYKNVNTYDHTVLSNIISIDYSNLLSVGLKLISLIPFINNNRKDKLSKIYKNFYI